MNLTMTDVQLAKILNSVWLPFGMIVLVKVGHNLALGGFVDTLYLAVSNLTSLHAFCKLKNMVIGNRRQFFFLYHIFSSTVYSAIML